MPRGIRLSAALLVGLAVAARGRAVDAGFAGSALSILRLYATAPRHHTSRWGWTPASGSGPLTSIRTMGSNSELASRRRSARG